MNNTKNKDKTEGYVFERDWKGNFRTVKVIMKEAEARGLLCWATEDEAWEYLKKNLPIDNYA